MRKSSLVTDRRRNLDRGIDCNVAQQGPSAGHARVAICEDGGAGCPRVTGWRYDAEGGSGGLVRMRGAALHAAANAVALGWWTSVR